MQEGTLLDIMIAPKAGAPMERQDQILAIPERGLEGDRYFFEAGSFSRWPGPHRDVTLIAEEDLDWIASEHGIVLPAIQSRRNLLVRGIDLNQLIKSDIQIGEVTLRGLRKCQPCKYLARKVGEPDLVKAMIHRGGLRAQVVSEGVLSIGARVVI